MKKNLLFLFLDFFIAIVLFLTVDAIKFMSKYESEKVSKEVTLEEKDYLKDIKDTVDIVEKHLISDKQFSKPELYNLALKGIINGLDDKYSDFYSEEELKKEVDKLNDTYVGLGFEASKKKGEYLEILSVYIDSPAFKAGLLSDDKIIEIDNKDTKDMVSDETISLIRGEIGSKVNLKVSRDDEIFNIVATRDKINSSIVDNKMLTDSIGYISISQFPMSISKEVKLAINKLKDEGMKKLILDLRGNTGGEILEVVPILSMLLPKENEFLFSVGYKNSKDEQYNRNSEQIFKGDIVVLVNSSTASASEILTGVLKDYKRATIVGEKTFGKGIIQTFFYLGSGNVLKLTSGKYMTPSKTQIHKKGINPDIELNMDNLLCKTGYINESDEQYKKRLELIKPVLLERYGEKKSEQIIKKGDIQLYEAIKILQ